MSTNHVAEILDRSKSIHLQKREDYATDPTANPFENFDRSNQIASWFPTDYASFAVLIGTKLARLGSLLIRNKSPKNESIDDSFLDLVTYCALFYGYWKEKTSLILKPCNRCGKKVYWDNTTPVICASCQVKDIHT